MSCVLIVEDEKRLRDIVRDYFTGHGLDCDLARDGAEALDLLRDHDYDAILLDILMPGLDGFAVCEAVRRSDDVPILFLTALGSERDVLRGYALGCDDYVTKPFAPMELLARVNSQLRRYSRYLKMADREEEHLYRIGGLELNEDTVQVHVDGEAVALTPLEFKILALLMRNPGRVFSAEEIYERVWQEKAIATETIMVHVRNIRQKIEVDPKNPKYLKVVWGVGYKIEKQ